MRDRRSSRGGIAMLDASLSGVRILIVEDEAIIAFDLLSVLTEAGAVVVVPDATLVKAKALTETADLSAVRSRYEMRMGCPDLEVPWRSGTPAVGRAEHRRSPMDWSASLAARR